MHSRAFVCLLSVYATLTLPVTSWAQEAAPNEVTADKALAAPVAEVPQGWAFKLTVGGTGSYGYSSNVVGTIDGSTVQLGLLVSGAENLTWGQSSWENDLKINEAETRTPQMSAFVKSADELALASTYLYHVPGLDWVGPYGRAAMTTQVFSSYDVRSSDVTIIRTFRNGTAQTKEIPAGHHIQLTKPFGADALLKLVGEYERAVVREDQARRRHAARHRPQRFHPGRRQGDDGDRGDAAREIHPSRR